jgi:hypothetical protein
MQKIIDWKYATHILYRYLSHASDLIQARGMKRFFEYHSLKNECEVICLMRRMANRRWKSAFPDIQVAVKMLSDYQVDKFRSIYPNTVSNDVYTGTIKNLIESCLKHEEDTKKLLNDEAKIAKLEDFDVIEDFAVCADETSKELMRLITCYNKYSWNSAYLEGLQKEMHDCYEEKTEEKFKMYFS